jgi:hypothetical protein
VLAQSIDTQFKGLVSRPRSPISSCCKPLRSLPKLLAMAQGLYSRPRLPLSRCTSTLNPSAKISSACCAGSVVR